jgi:ComF family protein
MRTSIRRLTQRIARAAVETAYPKTCAGCGMRGMWLCDLCEHIVPALSTVRTCARCGTPRHQNRCACRDLLPVIRRARAVYPYDGWAAASVRRLKYESEPARAEHLAALMVPSFAAFGATDLIVPVPLHESRERHRGYNQAELLSAELSRHTGVHAMPLLRRTMATPSQTTLTAEERRANVTGAFATGPSWHPRHGLHIVLVDDVRTTSSTLNACASALAACSPASIGVVTFAVDFTAERLKALRGMAATSGSAGP